MKKIFSNKLTSGFLILGAATILFTIIEFLVIPVFEVSIGIGSFGGKMTEANKNYQFYLPLALSYFLSAFLFFKEDNKFKMHKIPGIIQLTGNSLFVVIYAYTFFLTRQFLNDWARSNDGLFLILFIVAFLGLIVGNLLFVINILVSGYHFLSGKKPQEATKEVIKPQVPESLNK